MNPHSYTNADTNPSNLGQYWDPAGEYEYQDDVYTLLVYTPPRPPPRYLPKFLTREPVVATPHHVIRPNRDSPNYDRIERYDLSDMDTKNIKIKAFFFPADMRCPHVSDGNQKTCEQGCYVLEKGGDISRWFCKTSDCEGHVYVGRVRTNSNGEACFGKKGQKLICILP